MKATNEELKKLLNTDALGEAEKLTGKSYKDDETTESLGFMLHMDLIKKKEKALQSVDDTCFIETENEYFRKVSDFGFKTLLIKSFINSNNIEERFHVMFHYEYSILLVWDTFTYDDDGSWAKAGKSVPKPSRNGGKFYYNFAYDNNKNINGTSSGGLVQNKLEYSGYNYLFNQDFTPHILPKDLYSQEPILKTMNWEDFEIKDKVYNNKVKDYLKDKNLMYIYSGNHDCREGLKFKINNLASQVTFLKKWKEQPFLWLLNYMDSKSKDCDYNKIDNQIISELPLDVQEIIKGE